MKNSVKILVLTFFILGVLGNCIKAPIAPSNTDNIIDSNFVSKEDSSCINSEVRRMVIGEEVEYIRITTFDSPEIIIAPWYQSGWFRFDIDGDGTHDIGLYSGDYYSNGGTNAQISRISCLNSDFQMSTIEMFDTIFKCQNYINDSTYSLVYHNNYSSYTCSNVDKDSIYNLEKFSYPKVYSKGDTLTNAESWLSEDLILSYFDHSIFEWEKSYVEHSILKGNWNNMHFKYILLKKTIEDEYIIGWLKLSVDNHKEVRFYEYAIQTE
ncbi:hypothetical protein [Roseimarinus sediminis]|uniref:hypothetical protein n=1 Tax=Roseimarinus sediminis TaxID=1610899 RepID=UPI003D1E1734